MLHVFISIWQSIRGTAQQIWWLFRRQGRGAWRVLGHCKLCFHQDQRLGTSFGSKTRLLKMLLIFCAYSSGSQSSLKLIFEVLVASEVDSGFLGVDGSKSFLKYELIFPAFRIWFLPGTSLRSQGRLTCRVRRFRCPWIGGQAEQRFARGSRYPSGAPGALSGRRGWCRWTSRRSSRWFRWLPRLAPCFPSLPLGMGFYLNSFIIPVFEKRETYDWRRAIDFSRQALSSAGVRTPSPSISQNSKYFSKRPVSSSMKSRCI